MKQQRTTINFVSYSETQTCLQATIKQKRFILLWKGGFSVSMMNGISIMMNSA
jgi:hypothetical protein